MIFQKHSMSHRIAALLFVALLVTGVRADEIDKARTGASDRQAVQIPAGRSIVGLAVFPEEISLNERYAYRQVLVTAELDNGVLVDVTRAVEVAGATEAIEVTPFRRVLAKQDGESRLTFRLGEHSSEVAVEVSGQDADFEVSMLRDVQPVLSRLGCNSGTCHGSQKGQNGFKLSLRGYDPLYDHSALIDDLAGRRFNRAAPDRSLFLMKVSGAVPHVGGVLTKPGEPYYETLRAWVAAGVELDLDAVRVDKIEIFPGDAVIPVPGMEQQMAVVATFADGSQRDVTREAFLETSDIEVTSISREGVVHAIRRGEAAILARYQGRYAAAPLFIMGDREGFEWKDVPENNYIDRLVYAKLRQIKTLPSDLCTDAEFVRRVYLDLCGQPPTPRQTRAFLRDRRPMEEKRDELVDRLIGSTEFIEYWTNKWSDLLQVNPKFLGQPGAEALRGWIEGAVASNMPYDDFVYAVLNSSGSTLENPPTAYYKVHREPEALMENTTQLFLGVRFNCNKCHDHPFEKWTQSNYWELASYFAQVERKNAPGSKKLPNAGFANTGNSEELISDRSKGDVKFPNGAVAAPSFPYEIDARRLEESSETRRSELADWLTAEENPYFARSFVNRLWSYFLGVGFIDPVDDIRAGNPPSNPELLDKLTDDFIATDFDVRWLMRLICTSRTYQHSIETNRWNEDDKVNFSHAQARRLTAEQLYDAIHVATGRISRLPGQRLGTRAAALVGPNVKLNDGFLDLFGRPPRESACECERSSGMSLGQALNLVNGPTFADAINDPLNGISNLIEVERDARSVVSELFVSFLCREPTQAELDHLAATLNGRDPSNLAALDPADSKMLEEKFAGWVDAQRVADWKPITPHIVESKEASKLEVLEDGSILASGENPDTDIYTIVASTDLEKVTGIRLTLLPHDSFKNKGPGRAGENGNLVLSELTLSQVPLDDASKSVRLTLHNTSHTHAQKDFSSVQVIDGRNDDRKGWAIGNKFGQEHRAVFEVKEDVAVAGGKLLVFRMEQLYGGQHTIGRFRLEVTGSRRPVRVLSLPPDLAEVLLKPAEERDEADRTILLRAYLASDGEMQQRVRRSATQDLAWALANSPAFLFNR